jgi:hypothetical protein
VLQISQTYYWYPARLSDDNSRISDWLLWLTYANRTWGIRAVFSQYQLELPAVDEPRAKTVQFTP